MSVCELFASADVELYFYDELEAVDRVRVEKHLRSCEPCRQRLDDLHAQGVPEAQLYGADDDVYGGLNAFFLLMDKPETYELPNAANAVLPSRNNVRGYLATLVTGVVAVIGGLIALRRRREPTPEPVEAEAEPERV